MAEFLLSGRAIDWILGLVAVEAALALALRAARRGPAIVSFMANLLSGAFLLVALRNALAGGSAASISLCLTAGLIAHLADVYCRWERGSLSSLSSAPASRMRATLSMRASKAPPRAVRPAPTDRSSDR